MDKETNDNEYRRQSEHRTSAPKRKKKKKIRKLPIIL
ncbi:TPA: LytR family transcriptional regulator, partial [Staphylococcus aureus]|nr:LytR family transcriptional regulator [Staphylococcus aureus]